MNILAIDTSCDETAAAVTEGRKVLSHIEYSQVVMHKQWGGVVPSLAKRAHEERIDFVIEETMKKAKKTFDDIDYIAVTYGPGLAIALEVGIRTAKELAAKHQKKIIPVNHMEGHIYSNFVQNSSGNPEREFKFPYLALLVSGGHTELVLFDDHINYKILGQKLDDAAGEALDKAARMLAFGYPGGPVIERLAEEAGNIDPYKFPRPMARSQDLNFSFSGLKTSFLYFTRKMGDKDKTEHLRDLASSFQESVFASLIQKTKMAVKQTGITNIIAGGGVVINKRMRYLFRKTMKELNGTIWFPTYNYLTADNAAMIGVAAFYKAQKNIVAETAERIDRIPRLSLEKDIFIR